MPNSKKRNSLSDALRTVRPALKAPSSAPLPKTSSSTPRRPNSFRVKPQTAAPVSSTCPGIQGAPLSLAVRRQVLSTARAFLLEKQEERRPGDRLGLKCAFLASRRTSKASRFIRNLKENAIEQKLIAMQARMQEEDEEAVGPDQMLDEACQLAAQLHELSNNESINLEINKIAESITVCTDLLNNLHATGLSHTLHLDQIAAGLNTVHEGHGVSKALLEELQKDIAAMRTAIESMKINTGTVAPVVTRKSTPVTDDENHPLTAETCAESMCPLLDHLEEKTTMMLSQMGNDLDETTQSEDFFKDWVVSRASDVAEAHEDLKDEVDVATESDPEQSGRLSSWPSKWEDLLTASAARWRAQDWTDENPAELPMCWMRSEPSSFPLASMGTSGSGNGGGTRTGRPSGDDHQLQGANSQPSEEGPFPSLPFDGDEMWSAASDGHWIMPSHVASIDNTTDVHRLQRGRGSGRLWRRSLDAKGANEMHQNAKGYEATLSFLQQMSQREHQDDEERPLPSYFGGQEDGKRLPCLLGDKMSPSKACSKSGQLHDNSFASPFFPLGQEVEDATTLTPRCLKPELSEKSCSTSTSESSCRTSEGEFLFRSVDLPLLLGEDPPKISGRGGYCHNAEQRAEWNMQSLGAEEWEVMAMCLQCPGTTPLHQAALQGDAEVARLLLERGADLELKDEEFGETPLHFAAACGHTEMVVLLLEKKADQTVLDREGSTALDLAQKSHRDAVVQLLSR